MRLRAYKSRAEKLRIILSWIGISLLVLVALVTDSVWRTSEIAEECFNSVAIVCGTLGCLGRVWCLSYIAGRKNEELVTLGPYSLCRNPLYLFSLVGAVGIGLATCTVTFPLILLVGFIGLYARVIAAEETRMESMHGDAYRSYRTVTPRLLPDFRQYKPAERLALDVRCFQAGLVDSSWFLLGILGTHLIAELHEAGYGFAFFELV